MPSSVSRGWRSRYSTGGYSHWYVWCLLHILSRCRRHCCRFGKCCIVSVPKRNREILGRETSSAGGCRYWAAFGMPLWKQCCPDWCFAYPSCPVRPVPHGILEYTEQGEVYMVVIPEHVSFVCPYGYTNGGFLAIEQTVNLVFKFQTFAAPGRR